MARSDTPNRGLKQQSKLVYVGFWVICGHFTEMSPRSCLDSACWTSSDPPSLACGSISMTASSFDQQAWLDRIGYDGSREPTLDTLHQLIFAHSHAIAYESLDIMLGRTPRLDLASLQRKMIFGRRGGYCLEQNMLFREGLRSLGYKITSLQGRVVRGMAIDAPRPAIHMLLQVDMPEGPYLADVGFGNLAPTSALLLREGIEQATPHEPMRFVNVAGELTLQAKLRDTWEHIYRVIPYPRYVANTRSRTGIPARIRMRRIKATS